MRKLPILFVLITLISCNNNPQNFLTEGIWKAELQLKENLELPFNFEVTSPNAIKIFNADEVILVNDIRYSNDSVYIKMPVFEGYIAAKMTKNSLKGSFIKESLDRVVPFKAEFNTVNRFEFSSEANYNVSGNWETVFSPKSYEDSYMAKGIFNQEGNLITGTFRTTTGDYRYLEGVIDGDQMKLSTFDGAHAFLFTATVTDSMMKGAFYSGNHWEEPFEAKRNDNYELPDENKLTFLKEGYDAFEFSFPNASGEMVSLSDKRYKDKVVLVQIMGTWCPNCLDESKYYSEYYNANKDKDVEIVALAFEYAKTKEKAFKSIERLQNDVGINYPILLAQYGTSSKIKASEKLPMLNHVLSYPTTIFIDKKGKVRKIHTGFNGPATGTKYTVFKNEFNTFVDELLQE
ncbi:peroxiredoxin family protein [Ichthyenterobacterium magnum]|uniref:Peroxiredoxin n=1 Tax=Ichthyenterobacterium magnum TaxID=1230530 RepID=A0A420DKZ6_9FLAO|nr:TlpA disulfide reductase family protein [Ichthyenterobacterium magnum]RKE94889.1 peroxiredoxin [Ichthyenterobacterium magnum]